MQVAATTLRRLWCMRCSRPFGEEGGCWCGCWRGSRRNSRWRHERRAVEEAVGRRLNRVVSQQPSEHLIGWLVTNDAPKGGNGCVWFQHSTRGRVWRAASRALASRDRPRMTQRHSHRGDLWPGWPDYQNLMTCLLRNHEISIRNHRSVLENPPEKLAGMPESQNPGCIRHTHINIGHRLINISQDWIYGTVASPMG